jgi:S-layer protein
MAITTQMRTEVANLYVALFGRAPERDGLGYWVNQLDAGKTVAQVAQEMYNTSPARAYYPEFLTNEEVIGRFYTNVLGRTADADGLAYWTAKLNAGQSKGSVIGEMITAVTAYTGTDTAAVTSKALFTNKVAVGLYYAVDLGGNDVSAASSVLVNVTADAATVDAAKATAGTAVGQTFTLTTAAEQKTGGSGNDTFNGSDTTLVLDVLDGATGTDILNYNDATGAKNINAVGVSLTSIETINVRSVGAAAATTTGFTGVTDVNVLQGTTATVTAATTTNVSVAGVTDAITINGGNNVVVTDATAGKAIAIGGTTVGAGNVTVTDSNVGAATVAVDGGKAVTLNLTGSAGSTIQVGNGGAATDLPSGAVAITSNNKAVAATDETLSAITVKGGTTVSVTQTATSSVAASDTTGATVTQGDVTITGGAATTSVTVAQAKSTTEVVAVTAAAGTTESASVKFSALTAGQTLILGGLTFTASTAMTAAEAAAAFANLINGTIPTAGDTQAGGAASKGTYTGAFTGWTSGAASGDTVVFTSTTANTDVANLANTGTGTAVVTTTAGAAATAAVTGVLGVATGAVVIDDNGATASITSVSVDGYGGASTIGATNTLSKLANLSLANSGSTGTAGETDAAMTVDAAGVATLNLTLNAIKGAVSLDGAADNALKTLNVTASGADSSFALTAASVETLTVAGDKSVTLSADLAALKSVTVSGSAGLSLAAATSDTLTSVDTSATTGKVTATIDGVKATYTGGAGVDTVTLATSTALTKAINLGAGDDTLSFAALAVTGSSAALAGGDGTDTLAMSVAAADGLDGSAQSFYTGFERLTLNTAYGDDDDTLDTLTLNLANLGFTNYVTTAGTVADTTTVAKSDVLVLDKMASGGTVVLTAAGLVTVGVTDAATGTADVLNAVVTGATAGVAAGTLTAANVETINLTATDSQLDNDSDGVNDAVESHSLTLTADKATSVTITGNANMALTLTGSTKVATIDGSAMTGVLNVTSLNTTSATTIKGGSANDVLTAATGTTADVLVGGAGDDTLTANAGLTTLTGGTGNDLFVVGTASLNSSSYATITDFAAGDLIKFTGADSFAASKIVQADTAVFQDYANAAINAIGANDVAWFQFGGNTYVVMDAGADTTTFTNSQDFIVKLTGLVDLTNASFNDTHDTIAL